MLEETLTFYNCTKIPGLAAAASDVEVPITHVKVFHKRYPRLPRVQLPEVGAAGELAGLLKRRKSSRHFSEEPLALEELAEILESCRIVDSFGDFERRTYPSAGARFPVEIYPIVFRVAGLAPGCYHHGIEEGVLELLWDQDLRSREPEITSPVVRNSAACLVFTAVISRAEVKYGARAYPFSLLEAGHMAQNISLTATRIHVGSCAVGGFVADALSEMLDLTGDEIPIYGMALGKE